MMSDVCKHCKRAGCLESCPTGAIIRTEFETVDVQLDICNGWVYCVVACPFGVIDRLEDDGLAWKCTLCYDRLKDNMEPPCAKACPTNSIIYGEVDELRQKAKARVEELHERGIVDGERGCSAENVSAEARPASFETKLQARSSGLKKNCRGLWCTSAIRTARQKILSGAGRLRMRICIQPSGQELLEADGAVDRFSPDAILISLHLESAFPDLSAAICAAIQLVAESRPVDRAVSCARSELSYAQCAPDFRTKFHTAGARSAHRAPSRYLSGS